MTADALIELVAKVIQDASFDKDDILAYINKGIQEIAGVIDFEELSVTDTLSVTGGQTDAFISMPGDYQKKCFSIIDETNEVRIGKPGELYQYHKFIARHPVPDAGGTIADAAIRGKTLFFNPIPDANATLRVEYFRAPVILILGKSPEAIPAHLHESLLVPFAAKECYNLIEDGIEGRKVNYEVNEGLYRIALAELKSFIGVLEVEPIYTDDCFL